MKFIHLDDRLTGGIIYGFPASKGNGGNRRRPYLSMPRRCPRDGWTQVACQEMWSGSSQHYPVPEWCGTNCNPWRWPSHPHSHVNRCDIWSSRCTHYGQYDLDRRPSWLSSQEIYSCCIPAGSLRWPDRSVDGSRRRIPDSCFHKILQLLFR